MQELISPNQDLVNSPNLRGQTALIWQQLNLMQMILLIVMMVSLHRINFDDELIQIHRYGDKNVLKFWQLLN